MTHKHSAEAHAYKPQRFVSGFMIWLQVMLVVDVEAANADAASSKQGLDLEPIGFDNSTVLTDLVITLSIRYVIYYAHKCNCATMQICPMLSACVWCVLSLLVVLIQDVRRDS
jgi:hypothetical protein